MRILVACEESQAVTIEFRKLGFEAYSCDIQDCSGGHPEWHIKGDVMPLLEQEWDLIIAHPPCTYLTVTGNRWFNEDKYGEMAVKRKADREEAVKFFMLFASNKCPRICIENPVGVMSSRWRKSNQIIQPYYFGHKESKKTALWLKGLPELIPTNIVQEEERVFYKSGKSMPKWYADAVNLSKKERTKLRSKTFPGIAKAMAEQWGSFLKKDLDTPRNDC
jgi:site-specific DNA-cytosine methylase